MATNPFKILDAFGKEESKFFGGRNQETNELYELVTSGNTVVVFGESGVGKTSLVQCGLANKFDDSSWLDIWVRKGDNITQSLHNALSDALCEDTRKELNERKTVELPELIKEAYLDNFKPVYLIFDQFEDLYLLGTDKEREDFYRELEKLVEKKVSCKIIFVIKEDSYAKLHDLEKSLPISFRRGLKVSPMSSDTAMREVVVNYLTKGDIVAKPGVELIAQKIIDVCCKGKSVVYLPYLQVFLYTLWEKANKERNGTIVFDEQLIDEVGEIGNVIRDYMNSCVKETDSEHSDEIWLFLQGFVSFAGARQPVRISNESANKLKWAEALRKKRILNRLENNQFELAHESLVPLVLEKRPRTRQKLEDPPLKGNPYKGLSSFDPDDNERFFGREKVKKELVKKVEDNSLVAIVGPSGCGKSSVVKAGIIPHFAKEQQYEAIIEKPGFNPEEVIASIKNKLKASHSDILIFIDQFEELNTRCKDAMQADHFISFIQSLIANGKTPGERKIKIVLTVREDYEQEFQHFFPDNWIAGKFNVPPFLDEELRLIITEPAYYAGFDFDPEYLVDTIVRDAKSANGTLPLLSFALSQMHDKYQEEKRGDCLYTEDLYNKAGGVIGGLEAQVERILEKCPYEQTLRNVMLRMVAQGDGEWAGKRVVQSELVYSSEEENDRAQDILKQLINRKLVVAGVVAGADGEKPKAYIEPAHDALVRNVKMVRRWTRDNQETLVWQKKLSAALSDYEAYGTLWHNHKALPEISEIMQSDDCWLNKEEAEFISKSLQKKRELRRGDWLRKMAFVVTLLLFCAVAASSWWQKEAEKRGIAEKYTDALMLKNGELIAKNKAGDSLINELNKQKYKIDSALALEQDLRSKAEDTSNLYKALSKEYSNELHKSKTLNDLLAIQALHLRDTADLAIRQKDSLHLTLGKIELQKEYFYSALKDRELNEHALDALLHLRYKSKDIGRFEQLKKALNLIAEAYTADEPNPNVRFYKARESHDIEPYSDINDIALNIANSFLFYKQRVYIEKRNTETLGLSSFNLLNTWAPLSRTGEFFAINSDSRIIVGRFSQDSLFIQKTIPIYPASSRGNYDSLTGLFSQNSKLLTLQFTNDNRLIAATSEKFFIWKINGNDKASFRMPAQRKNGFYTVAFSPDGKKMLTDYDEYAVKQWPLPDMRNGSVVLKVDKSDGFISRIKYSLNGKLALAVTSKRKYYLIDFSVPGSKSSSPVKEIVYNLDFAPGSGHFVYNDNDSIYVTDIKGNKFGKAIKHNSSDVLNGIHRIILSPDWKSMVVQYSNNSSELIELFSNSEKDSVFYVKPRNSPQIKTKKFIGEGNFGFLQNSSILSFANQSNSLTLYLNKNYPLFDNFSAARQSISIPDPLNVTEEELHSSARIYLDQYKRSYPKSSGLTSLYKARALYKQLISSFGKDQEIYLNAYKDIYNWAFGIDSNYSEIVDGMRLYIKTIEETIKKSDSGSNAFKRLSGQVSWEYGRLAWFMLFIKKPDYEEVIRAAQKSISMDRQYNDWVNTNLALGNLFAGKFKEAEIIYETYKFDHYTYNGKSFRTAFLEDLADLEWNKAIPKNRPDIQQEIKRIKAFLNSPKKTFD